MRDHIRCQWLHPLQLAGCWYPLGRCRGWSHWQLLHHSKVTGTVVDGGGIEDVYTPVTYTLSGGILRYCPDGDGARRAYLCLGLRLGRGAQLICRRLSTHPHFQRPSKRPRLLPSSAADARQRLHYSRSLTTGESVTSNAEIVLEVHAQYNS